MESNMCLFSSYFVYLITVFIGTIFYIKFNRKFKCLQKYTRELSTFKIFEVANFDQCHEACSLLISHCQELSVLGFDCEWGSRNSERKLVPLLQLSSCRGLCCVFKVFEMGGILHPLENLLQDKNILKVGDLSFKNSKLLLKNCKTQVQGALDVRYLYNISEDLASQSNKDFTKLCHEWLTKCSDYESLELTKTQRDYASFVAIEIFKKWLCIISRKDLYSSEKIDCNYSYKLNYSTISKYTDIDFEHKNVKICHKKFTDESKNSIQTKEKAKEIFVPRKSPLYDNFFMYAPDGQLLCSCDKKKAQWYLDKGLAEIFPGKSNAIKLLFEPAGRADKSNEGGYYQQLKENICVVCGASKSYLRHRVVPKEYRKHFPEFMKDHQSHDVVLMCIKCHHLASQHNYDLRQKLVILCNAPLTESTVVQIKVIQKIKNYANALLKSSDVIPIERRHFMENEIRKFFKKDVFAEDLLYKAANLQSTTKNENYVSHGLKVVNYFSQKKDGLIQLEKLWREHFLKKMNPQYLPTLWSVSHNHSKLKKTMPITR